MLGLAWYQNVEVTGFPYAATEPGDASMKIRSEGFPVSVICLGCVILAGTPASAAEPEKTRYADMVPTPQQQAEARALAEQLVFSAGEAQNRPIRAPSSVPGNAQGKEQQQVAQKPAEAPANGDDRRRFEQCLTAFRKLAEMKMTAFPVLVEHLGDKRQSINFRNHHLGNSVGDACHWNIYFQLQDQPENYSSYGYSRAGRDGQNHPKPYWEGTPFDAAGGLKPWLEQNKQLTYPQMQIKCLSWLLAKEKEIGAADAESYFVNILPLEIRILQRRQEAGEDVAAELGRLQQVLKKKDPSAIPPDLLPAK